MIIGGFQGNWFNITAHTLENGSKLPIATLKDEYKDDFAALTQNKLEQLKQREPSAGLDALTDKQLKELNEKYDTNDMTCDEYHSFLSDLVDMGALTESLFESELFGHVKGAFTDARTDRIGKFEIARGGTLFLDEIGNLSYHLQAKLLSAIQSRSIVRVGSNLSVPTDIRLICATNRNLPEMVTQKQFREDLLYRINTIHIEIPSLRERKEDILPLAEMFLSRYAAKYHKQGLGIDTGAQKKLRDYPWPGNIRELQHTVEKAVIVCETENIAEDNLLMASPQVSAAQPAVSTLEQMERDMIVRAIRINDGNMSAVAAQLGITRQTLYNKIKKYEL